jgi:hypothetical protein
MLGPPKPRRLDEPIAVSLEELVPQNNFDRLLETKLDLSFVREWSRELYADLGRPSIDPVIFFKLQLVMFFEGIRSKHMMRWSLRPTSGSMAGRPRSAYSSRVQSRTKLRSNLASRWR